VVTVSVAVMVVVVVNIVLAVLLAVMFAAAMVVSNDDDDYDHHTHWTPFSHLPSSYAQVPVLRIFCPQHRHQRHNDVRALDNPV
jgi:hypothetical protein